MGSNPTLSAFASPKPARAKAGFARLRRDAVRLRRDAVRLWRDAVRLRPDEVRLWPDEVKAFGVTQSAFATLKRGYGATKSAVDNAKAGLDMYYVYSLKCKDGYYVGCADNLEDRLDRHKKGSVPATANRLPVELDFYFAINDKYRAFEFEKYLKSGSGRAFIRKHLI